MKGWMAGTRVGQPFIEPEKKLELEGYPTDAELTDTLLSLGFHSCFDQPYEKPHLVRMEEAA